MQQTHAFLWCSPKYGNMESTRRKANLGSLLLQHEMPRGNQLLHLPSLLFLSSSLYAVVPNLSFNTGVAALCLVGHRVPALPTADPLGSFPRTASRQQAWLAAFQIVQVTFPFTNCVTLKSLLAFVSLIGL